MVTLSRGLEGVGIAFANNFPGPGLGGGERHLIELVDACVREGMAVSVLCVHGSPVGAAAREAGASIREIPMSAAHAVRAARAMRAHCRQTRAEILHTTGYLTNLIGRLAVRGSTPVLVSTVHVDPAAALASGGGRAAHGLRMLAERLTAHRPALVLPVSEAVAAALPAIGYDPSRLLVIHNGVDVARVLEEASGGVELPEGFAGADLVGIVARLERVKSVDVFLRAAAMIADDRPGARFVVAGDGPLRAELEALARSLGLGDRVAFLGWVEPASALIGQLDVCALTSASEGMPITVLEAMALGVPVVATDVGGVREAVDHGRTGLLAPAGGVRAVAEAVSRLLGDEDLRARMGDAARERAAAEFSVESMREAHLEAYAELLARAGTSPPVRE